jgi:energy-coupling factor transporter ATP-binding protein EcfA2
MSTNSQIVFGQSVNMKQAVSMVATLGQEITYLFQGEPGVGKSTMLKELGLLFPDHETAYIDCANLDLGDIAMPFIDRELNCTRYYPNAYFKLHTGKPVIIMLDELTKATQSVQNMLLPLILESRLGDIKLPKGSMVFATGNMLSDGVGDHLKAHTRNRMDLVVFRKPTADEWIKNFALRNNVTQEVIAFVDQYPETMVSYMDPGTPELKYVYNPKDLKNQIRAFCSPRSLEKASHVIKARSKIGDEAVIASLIGLIGESAARDLQAFISVADQLPTLDAIKANPEEAMVPSDPVALCILTYKAVMQVEKDWMDKWVVYLERTPKENQGLFARSLLESANSRAAGAKAFIDWAIKNNYMFAKAAE